MTEEHEESDLVDRYGPEDCHPDNDEKEVRTDGGVAVDGTAATDTHPAGTGPIRKAPPRRPSNSEPSVDGPHSEDPTERDFGTNSETAEPKESVMEHFSQPEVARLQAIAASTGTQSTWVIKRLLQQRDD